ncbi:aminodeoxychorismate synthase component I [Penaeicola halotolerans]|uniref:aminodeoxychorismate synthase component I n=1 Tax=Penaeicola halotolerans TaxID=2793196 RepID=UPI001CF8E949|nr:aminodeoxychorismate synthase component I [Penaeicola halotolerans]
MKQVFTLTDPLLFEQKALHWANQYFIYTCFLNPNTANYPFGAFEKKLAAAQSVLPIDGLESLDHLAQKDAFGFLSYELKNQIEKLTSQNSPTVEFPALGFFEPEILITWLNDSEVTIISDDPAAIYQAIIEQRIQEYPLKLGAIHASMPKAAYLEKVNQVRQHIYEGDVYELNLCMEFHAQIDTLDPVSTYFSLNTASPKPFSSFLKWDQKYALCASPERFLRKKAQQLLSQPIKGTTRRDQDPTIDLALKHELAHSEKERAENMMIVDLVRNDLARCSESGSVKVEEMFGIYSFEQVHQMISSVSATAKSNVGLKEILQATFPMGSMTGAPKIMAMQLIDQYETVSRGLYSGSIGYITAEGDFDFNVVIRTILLDMDQSKLSFQVGSAITYDSDPEAEYQECLLKAKAILQILDQL